MAKILLVEDDVSLVLFISKRFVDAHGGTIWCERNGTRGTVFSFSLPLQDG